MPSGILFSKDKNQKARLGFIGVGLRGQNHLQLAPSRKDLEVVAICDVQQHMIDMSKDLVKSQGSPCHR